MKYTFGNILGGVRAARPIIHSITNYVAANDCANILLACGASPIMSDDPAEAEDIASLASAVSLNLGTLSDRRLEAMLRAGKTANALGRPVVLDPVGAGSSRHRTEAARTLMENVSFALIRGNISEIRALNGASAPTGGVDAAAEDSAATSAGELSETVGLVRAFAKRAHTTAAVTGETDIVTDGERLFLIHNGHPMMRDVTGTGCQLSSLAAAFAAVCPDDALTAAAAAFAAMGIAGERAHRRLSPDDGSGSYRTYIIDAIYNMTPEILDREADYEIRP